MPHPPLGWKPHTRGRAEVAEVESTPLHRRVAREGASGTSVVQCSRYPPNGTPDELRRGARSERSGCWAAAVAQRDAEKRHERVLSCRSCTGGLEYDVPLEMA